MSIPFDSVTTDALEEVLTLIEQKFGANTQVPDALTSIMLLAALQNHGGGWLEVTVLVREKVLAPCYLDIWKVYFTGNPSAILDPDVPVQVHEDTAWASTAYQTQIAGEPVVVTTSVPVSDLATASAPTTPVTTVTGPLAEVPDLAAAVPTSTATIPTEAPKEAA